MYSITCSNYYFVSSIYFYILRKNHAHSHNNLCHFISNVTIFLSVHVVQYRFANTFVDNIFHVEHFTKLQGIIIRIENIENNIDINPLR